MRSELASRAGVARAREEGERGVRGSRGRAGSRRWDPWSRVASRPRRRAEATLTIILPLLAKRCHKSGARRVQDVQDPLGLESSHWIARSAGSVAKKKGICCQEKRDLGPLNSDETGNPDDQLGNERGGWRVERSWSGRDTAPSRRDGGWLGEGTLGEARQG